MRVDEDGNLENSTDFTNLLVDEFRISVETTGGDESCINGNHERHNIIIHNMVIVGLLESNKNGKMALCSRNIIRDPYI